MAARPKPFVQGGQRDTVHVSERPHKGQKPPTSRWVRPVSIVPGEVCWLPITSITDCVEGLGFVSSIIGLRVLQSLQDDRLYAGVPLKPLSQASRQTPLQQCKWG